MTINNTGVWIKWPVFFSLLFLAQGVFAAPPIQGGAMHGAAAADARQKLISTAESFLGTPYRYAGLNKSGIDCSGLVYMSFRESLDITIPRTSVNIYNWTEKISTNDLQPGDLVFFITTGRNISHLGIYTGGGRFIHSASEGPQTGVIYSSLDESYWKRAYHGAGRALPWDKEAAALISQAAPSGVTGGASNARSGVHGSAAGDRAPAPSWAEHGAFAGFGAAWTWGGFTEGSSSVFRGFSALATIGYKWSKLRIGLELRPEWDRALDVFRLPVTLSAGNKYFQAFAGPAITFGDPSLNLSYGERRYSGGGEWSWELGLSFSLPFVTIKSGALAIYGETAWHPYSFGSGETSRLQADFTANVRFSTGFKYLWRI